MKIDVFTATGTKKGSIDLPETLFGARINQGLMHQAVMLQQSNRRNAIAHAKNRGEVTGSTKKLYAQKHTGRARRGSVRSPLLRGGGKAFGPRSNANFTKDMPKSMRRAALLSCLSFRAKQGAIVGLESYPDTVKTKDMAALLSKMPVELGRRILLVLPARHRGVELSARNLQRVKTLDVNYLNAEDILNARHIVFFTEAIAKAEQLWGSDKERVIKTATPDTAEKKPAKKAPSKKPVAKKTSTKTSA